MESEMLRALMVLLLVTIGQAGAPRAAAPRAQAPLTLLRSIGLPSVKGRIDHLAVDLPTGRVFVAALGNDSIEVVDGRAGAWLRRLSGFHEPQGVALSPDDGVLAVANGQGGDLTLVDRTDYHVIRTVPLGDDADNVRYDADAKRFFVGYGSGAIAAVEPDGRRVGEVKLAGHPESFQLERNGSRIFVNVPDAHHIAVLDRTAMKLLATWPVGEASANYPMALDETNHRLFVGCRRPAVVLVFDTSSGQRVTSAPIVGDTDDLFYDATRKRLYVTGGEGYIDVLQQGDADHLTRVARLASAAGARTSLYVPDQGRLYLAVPRRGTQKSGIRVYEARD
jgi:DNA-binding beta-propeller fold protein YncE